MSNRDIFISYSRKDLKKVAAIRKNLEEATSIECWMDLEGIESGAIRFTKMPMGQVTDMDPQINGGDIT